MEKGTKDPLDEMKDIVQKIFATQAAEAAYWSGMAKRDLRKSSHKDVVIVLVAKIIESLRQSLTRFEPLYQSNVWEAMRELVFEYFATLRRRNLPLLTFQAGILQEVYDKLTRLPDKPIDEWSYEELMARSSVGPYYREALPLVRSTLQSI